MSTTKRTLGDYTIQTLNGNVYIVGNLIVSGNTTTINSTNSNVEDNIITLNAGEVGPGVTLGYAGIEVDRGVTNRPAIRWNESYKAWELTNTSGTTLGNIATVVGAGTLTSVAGDTRPALGGNLNLAGSKIWDSTLPTANVSIGIGLVGSGGTGIYVTNSKNTTPTELATKKQTITYSIIFG
jgi:hypothetical protein